MRKLTTKLTSIALVASFTTGLLPLALAANTGTINSDDVRLRKKASTSSASLDMLEKGDKVNVLSAEGDDWYKVAYTDEDGEHTGYVSAEFVDTSDKAAKKEKSSDSKTEQKKATKTAKKTEKTEKDTQKAAADLSDVSLGAGTVTRGSKKYKRINLRASSSQDGDIVYKVPVGSTVEILADQDSTGWYQVRYTGQDKTVYSGYMDGDYVDTAVSSTPSTTATVVKSGKVKKVVYIRSEKSTDAKVLYKVPVGEAITVVSDADSDGWYQVSYTSSLGKTYNGYMREEYVDTDNSTASSLTGVVSTKRKFIYIRSEKSTDAKPLCKVPAGKTISVLGAEEDGWYQVRYKDSKGTHKGYMVSKYVKVNGVSTGIIGTSTAVLRASADNSSAMLDVIPKDTEVNILASLGDWYQVEYDDQIGYVDSSCIGSHAGSASNSSSGYGTVSSDSVRLRAERSTDSGILATLTKGDTFQITSSKKGWYGTTFNGVEGYVKADYVSASDSISSGYIQVTATPSIMLRKGAGTEYEELGTIPCGTLLEVQDTMGSWYKVEYEGKTGYVTGDYVSATTEDGFQAYPDYAKITADELSLRDKPEDEGERIAGIGEGTVVHVYDMEKGWYRVTYGDQVGYINSDYTQEDEGPATPIPSPEEEAPENEEGGSAGSTASDSNSDSDSGSDSDSSSESDSDSESESESSGESEGTEASSSSSSGSGSAVLAYAEQFVGNPYKWGGSSLTNGCDCSGFVMSVYAHFGKSLPHSSSADRSVGRGVSVSDMQPGDIVCYSGHVGIYAGGGQLLSALGKNYGITYNSVHYKKILAVRRLT